MSFEIVEIAQPGKPWTDNPDNSGWWLKVRDVDTGDVFNLDTSAASTYAFNVGDSVPTINWRTDKKPFVSKYPPYETWYKGEIPSVKLAPKAGRGPQGAPPPASGPKPASAGDRPAGTPVARPAATVGAYLAQYAALWQRTTAMAGKLWPTSSEAEQREHGRQIATAVAIKLERGELVPDPTPEQRAEAERILREKREREDKAREDEAAQRLGGYSAGSAPGGDDIPF